MQPWKDSPKTGDGRKKKVIASLWWKAVSLIAPLVATAVPELNNGEATDSIVACIICLSMSSDWKGVEH